MLILICDSFDASLPGKLSRFGEVTSDCARLKEADVCLVRSKTHCDKEFIDSASRLKMIIRGGVGIDTIDVEYAKKKGIVVHNTPCASSVAVAELVMAHMVSVPAHLIAYHNGMKDHQWLKKKMKRTELYQKRLALVGFGHIAREVAVRAKAFGMEISYFDCAPIECNYAKSCKSLEEAVRDADYISLHLPLTDSTRGLINKELLEKCEKNPVVINSCRALVVNQADMLELLESGKVSWYCTDVWPSDPPEWTDPLIARDNVTLTPHAGANTAENLLRIGDEVCSLIEKEIKEGTL